MKADPALVRNSLRDAVHARDSDLPVANFSTLSALVDTSMTADRFSMLLLSAFGAIALLLASVGMYDVISYSVMQRTPEIGIRIALGAQRSQIFSMVINQGLGMAGLGIAIGLIAAFRTTKVMTRFLYGVQPTDPVTFAGISFLLVVNALLACDLPARRATRVDPVIALRYE
jgi:ABC-type antimicrobial peptide transport system permease subunit